MSATPPDYSHDYGYAPPLTGSASARSASVWLWVGAGLLLLGSSCCGIVAFALHAIPLADFKKQDTEGQIPAADWDQLAALQPYGLGLAALVAMAFVIPAAVLLVLAFKVRRGSRGATLASLWVLGLPTVVLALVTLLSLLGGVATQGPGAVVNALPLAGVVALLGYTWRLLWAALRDPADPEALADGPSSLDDPWEHTL